MSDRRPAVTALNSVSAGADAPTRGRVRLADLHDDVVLNLLDAARLVRRKARRLSFKVIVRWCVSGVRGRKLPSLRRDGVRCVRVGDLRAFLRESRVLDADAKRPGSRSPRAVTSTELVRRMAGAADCSGGVGDGAGGGHWSAPT